MSPMHCPLNVHKPTTTPEAMAHLKAVLDNLSCGGPEPGPPDPPCPKCRSPWFCTCHDVIYQCSSVPYVDHKVQRPRPRSMRSRLSRSRSPAPSDEASTRAHSTHDDTSSVTGHRPSLRFRYPRSRSPSHAQKTVQPQRPLHPDERPASRSHAKRPGQNT